MFSDNSYLDIALENLPTLLMKYGADEVSKRKIIEEEIAKVLGKQKVGKSLDEAGIIKDLLNSQSFASNACDEVLKMGKIRPFISAAYQVDKWKKDSRTKAEISVYQSLVKLQTSDSKIKRGLGKTGMFLKNFL